MPRHLLLEGRGVLTYWPTIVAKKKGHRKYCYQLSCNITAFWPTFLQIWKNWGGLGAPTPPNRHIPAYCSFLGYQCVLISNRARNITLRSSDIIDTSSCSFPRLCLQLCLLGPEQSATSADDALLAFPQNLDEMPGSQDLLNTPLIKVVQLASEELYPPSKWGKMLQRSTLNGLKWK